MNSFHIVVREDFKLPTGKISAQFVHWFPSYGIFIAHFPNIECVHVKTLVFQDPGILEFKIPETGNIFPGDGNSQI